MFSYLVSRPAAPAPVSTSGPHLIAHRRIAKGTGANGGAAHTIATSATTPSTLPTNVTVGVYSDTYAFLRDEFLVSADSGVTWRLVPSPTVVSAGVYTIPAYSSSWATVSDFDNQATQADALNFGEYSAGNNPSLTRYYRLARPCQTLGVELRTTDNDPLTVLDNRMTIGVGGVLGSGGQLTQGSTIVYNSSRSNFRPLVGLLGDIVKLTFQLTAYPAEGFASDTVNFRTLIIPDAAVSALPAGWTNNTIRLDPALGFGLPLISRLSSTAVSLAPLQVNFGGILVRNPANRTFTTVEGTSYQITVNTSGEFALRADNYVPAIGEITVISFTPNTSGVRVLGCLPLDNPAKVIGGSGVLYGRPVSPSGAAWAAGDLGGVSLGDGSMAIAGDVAVQVTGPVAVGDTLTPASATGFSVGSGPLRVIQGSQGSGAGVAIARLQPVGSGGGTSISIVRFSAYLGTGSPNNRAANTYVPIVYDQEIADPSSIYSTSTGVFTVPKALIALISVCMHIDAGGGGTSLVAVTLQSRTTGGTTWDDEARIADSREIGAGQYVALGSTTVSLVTSKEYRLSGYVSRTHGLLGGTANNYVALTELLT